MTERLYYHDASLLSFEARVVRVEAGTGGQAMVVLDRTAFYPTSGGQPHDVGRLDAAAVVDVLDGEAGEILHVVDAVERALMVGQVVGGQIDGPRRFDHMQQHTGQHVLSAAFERVFGVPTASVHLGATVSTIDLDREVTLSEITRAEDEANRVVWEDRPVMVRFVDADEALRLPLRKDPKRTGAVRLVEVEAFDLSACGGTHVSRTGSVGVIAVAGWERFKGGTRLTFVCGGRALDSHRRLRDTVTAASRVLSVAAAEITPAIEKLREEARLRERRLADQDAELVAYRAGEWRARAETIGPYRSVIRHDPTADGALLKAMAQAIVEGDAGLVAVIVGGGTPAPIVAARSAGVLFDAGAFIRSLTSLLGGRGGGRPELAQGGVGADADRVLVAARDVLAAGLPRS
jgi:alanyl-tRNA synthetase